MPKYIIKDIESYCDEYDKEGPDEENSNKENSMRKILMKKIELWFYNSRRKVSNSCRSLLVCFSSY